MDLRYEDYAQLHAMAFSAETNQEDRDGAVRQLMALPQEDTRIADYVWLPIRFDGEMGYLDWMDEWKLENMP